MSYIRSGWPMQYVEGGSKDYIFISNDKEKPYIEDYSNISDEGLIELFFRYFECTNDSEGLFKKYLGKKLAERLGVKLRKKRLSSDEVFKLMRVIPKSV